MSGSASKTEQPTAHKLRDARKKGQVAKSKEVVSTSTFIVSGLYFWLMWDRIVSLLKELILLPSEVIALPFTEAIRIILDKVFISSVYWIIIPFMLIMLIATLVANIAQFGFLLVTDPIIPKFEKINPASGFKKIFSKKSLADTAMALLKICVIGLVVFFLIKSSLSKLVHDIAVCDLDCNILLMREMVWRLIVTLTPLLIAITIIDVVIQKSLFIKQQMMSKDEVKREHKNQEGDPLIKGQRKRDHTELVMNSLHDKIRSSRVLITDVDVSIAVRYIKGETPLPIIMAIGQSAMARQMKKVASSEGLPVIEDSKAIVMLLEEGKVDQYIPDDAISDVVRVLRQVS